MRAAADADVAEGRADRAMKRLEVIAARTPHFTECSPAQWRRYIRAHVASYALGAWAWASHVRHNRWHRAMIRARS
jgi:hypothetical protein